MYGNKTVFIFLICLFIILILNMIHILLAKKTFQMCLPACTYIAVTYIEIFNYAHITSNMRRCNISSDGSKNS